MFSSSEQRDGGMARRFAAAVSVAAVVLLVAVVSVGVGAAQDARGLADDGAAISPSRTAQLGFDARESRGLFVGISRFRAPAGSDAIRDVRFAVDDAVDLAARFVDLGLLRPEATVLAISGDPRNRASRAALASLVDRGAKRVEPTLTNVYAHIINACAGAGRRGFLILGCATHGYTQAGRYNLLCADSDLRLLDRTGVSVEWLKHRAAASQAKRRLVLIDACRDVVSASRAIREDGARLVLSTRMRESVGRSHGLAVLYSTRAGGFSYDDEDLENGVFTGAVLAGLRGGADHVDGLITVGTLATFVDRRVASWFREHAKGPGGIARELEGRAADIPLAERRRTRRTEAQAREALLKMLADYAPDRVPVATLDAVRWAVGQRAHCRDFEPVVTELDALRRGGAAHLPLFLRWWRGEGARRFGPLTPDVRTTGTARVIRVGTPYSVRFRFPAGHAALFCIAPAASASYLAFPNRAHWRTRVDGYRNGFDDLTEDRAGTVRWIAVATRRPLRIDGIDADRIRTSNRLCVDLPNGADVRVGFDRDAMRPLDAFLRDLTPADGASAELRLTVVTEGDRG